MQTQMTIVRFVGSLRGAAGRSRATLKLEKTMPLRQAVQKLCEQIPKLNQAFAQTETRHLNSNMLILVNGKEISALEGLNTHLKDEDEIVFIPIVHGG